MHTCDSSELILYCPHRVGPAGPADYSLYAVEVLYECLYVCVCVRASISV